MSPYKTLSEFYDTFNAHIDYQKFGSFYQKTFQRYHLCPNIVVDLACGSGTLTQLLAQTGYDMIGIDISEEMLNIAFQKKAQSGLDILYLQQDICDFELYGTVSAFVCSLDSMNHILNKADLLRCFKSCMLYLDPGGLLIFDINTRYYFEKVLHANAAVYQTKDVFCVTEHTFDKKSKLFYYDLAIFNQNNDNEFYQKCSDCIIEREYSLEEIQELLKRAGFNKIYLFDNFTFKKPTQMSQRVFFVAKKE